MQCCCIKSHYWRLAHFGAVIGLMPRVFISNLLHTCTLTFTCNMLYVVKLSINATGIYLKHTAHCSKVIANFEMYKLLQLSNGTLAQVFISNTMHTALEL